MPEKLVSEFKTLKTTILIVKADTFKWVEKSSKLMICYDYITFVSHTRNFYNLAFTMQK